MATYRFLAVDALTGTELGELPLSGPAWGPTLNAGLSIQGTIDPQVVDRSLVEPWQVIIYAYRDDQLWGGGIVNSLTPKSQSVVVNAVGFETYPNYVPLIASLTPAVYQDPLVITRQLWAWMQGEPDADLGVALGTETTNGKVKVGTPAAPYTMNWWDAKTVGSYISDLSGDDDGFDFRVDVTHDDTRAKTLILGYPRLGARRTDIAFDSRTNIASTPDEQEGAPITDVMVTGTGSGRNTFMAVQGRRGTGHLQNGLILAAPNEGSQSRLERYARTALTAGAYPRSVSTLVIREHPDAPFGTYRPGDDVHVHVADGWSQYDGWVRVMGWQAATESGQEQVTVSVTRSDQFVYGPDPDITVDTGGGE